MMHTGSHGRRAFLCGVLMDLDLMNLLAVLASAWLAGRVAGRLGYPAVLGELMVGILLGPPVLGLLYSDAALGVLAELGVLLMMLYIGMEIDPRELRGAAWPGLPAALLSFVLPFALAWQVVVAFGGSAVAGVFLGIAAGMTSLATGARILSDMRMLDTRIAHVMMTSALIADTLSLLVFAGVVHFGVAGELRPGVLGWMAARIGAFFLMVILVGAKALPAIYDRLRDAGLTDRTSHFMLALMIAVLFGELAELAGLHAILGAFVAGMFLREDALGKALSCELRGAVREASLGFLAPIFFVTAGFKVSFAGLLDNLPLLTALLAVAALTKVVAVGLTYRLTGHGWREGVVTGAGMNGRGAVEIIIAGLGYELGLLDQQLFSVLVIVSICTTALVPPALKLGVTWLDARGELLRGSDRRRGTVIVGAGPTARALGRAMQTAGPVCLVDTNPEHCAQARAEGLSAVRGDALQEAVLCRTGASRARALVAMTPNNEVNVLVAQLARSVFEIPSVHVLNSGRSSRGLSSAMRHLSARFLFGNEVPVEQWDRMLSEREGHSKEVTLEPELHRGTPEESTEDDPSLILAVWRDDELEPYDGTALEERESVILLRARAAREA